jgi:iron complex transport system substrate-binding protein
MTQSVLSIRPAEAGTQQLAPQLVFDPSRRRFVTGSAAALLLAACGADEGPDRTVEGEGDGGGFPRTVTHGLGDTEIPSRPRRIVATSDRDQLDVLLAMDVKPVLFGFSGDYEVAAPWLDPTTVETLDHADMPDAFVPNLERIAAARPDLIIDAWSDESGHDALSAIAPTVQIKTSENDSWDSAQRLAGEACGTEDAAETAITETRSVIDQQAGGLRARRGRTIAVAFQQGDELVVLPGTAIGGRIVAELGLTVLDTSDGAPGAYSLEQIPDILGPADMILSFDYGGLADQEANQLFRALPAVRAGGYVTVTTDAASACYQESSLSLRWVAPEIADAVRTGAEGGGHRF